MLSERYQISFANEGTRSLQSSPLRYEKVFIQLCFPPCVTIICDCVTTDDNTLRRVVFISAFYLSPFHFLQRLTVISTTLFLLVCKGEHKSNVALWGKVQYNLLIKWINLITVAPKTFINIIVPLAPI